MHYETGNNISYFEYKAINELMHSHSAEFGEDLRAIIVFGPLLTAQNTFDTDLFDIDLLEVINNWQGPEHLSYSSTESLPLRGTLRLNFLSSSDFESLTTQTNPVLVDKLREGYKIVYEVPAGYARRILAQGLTTNTRLTAGDQFSTNDRFADPRKPLMR